MIREKAIVIEDRQRWSNIHTIGASKEENKTSKQNRKPKPKNIFQKEKKI